MQRLALLRHQLEDEQRGDEAVVGVVEVAEVVVSGDFAGEDAVLLTHPLLDERMADAVHQRPAAVPGHGVPDGVARAQVVDDRRAGVLQEKRLGQERRHEVARDELAAAVDEEAAVGVAVPGDADVGALADDFRRDVLPVLLDQRIRLVVRERPVDLEAEPRHRAGEPIEQQRRHQAGHAAAGVEHDLERLDDRWIDERHHLLDVAREECRAS